MAKYFIARTAEVNIDLLHEQLTSITGYDACSAHPTGVTVYFSGNVDLNALQAIVLAHNEKELSNKQSQVAALKTEISTLKSQIGNIDNLTAQEGTAAIKLLYKVLRVNDLI